MPDLVNVDASGGLVTTTEDLNRFLRALLSGRLLRPSELDQMKRTVPTDESVQLAFPGASSRTGQTGEALALPAPEGGFLRNGNVRRRVFDDAAARAGIRDATPHGQRHSAASLAIAAGATVVLVQRMLGHSSPKVTPDVYAYLFADDLDALAGRLHDAKIKSDADRGRTARPVTPLPTIGGDDRDSLAAEEPCQ